MGASDSLFCPPCTRQSCGEALKGHEILHIGVDDAPRPMLVETLASLEADKVPTWTRDLPDESIFANLKQRRTPKHPVDCVAEMPDGKTIRRSKTSELWIAEE